MVFVGGAALMLWFRDQGWHWAGALVAALAFCYGASMAWRIQHIGQVLSLAYLPLAMLCLERALARRSILYGAAAGVVAACIVLGRDQVALLVVYLLIAFVLWRLLSADRPADAVRASLLPLSTGAVAAAALIAVPVMLTALLAAESNRPSIDYVGAGRGSLHPALLLTFFAPEVFGASGRMEDYWGPPSFAWQGTGIFLAQNMGQLYIGAIPVILLLLAALRGRLWAREIRFFTVAAGVALLYALGWYTPVFRMLYELLPGVSLYRRPADATFLIGALAAILAGYSTHRLFEEPLAELTRRARHVRARRHRHRVRNRHRPRLVARPPAASWCSRSPSAAISLAAGAGALAVARRRIPLQPVLAAAIITGVHGRRPCLSTTARTAPPPCRPQTYDVLQPNTANATIALLKKQGRAVRHAPRSHRAGGARLPLAQRQPHARAGEHAGLQSHSPRPLQRGDRRRGHGQPARSAQVLAAVSLLSLDRSPTCWACASSPPARRSRPWTEREDSGFLMPDGLRLVARTTDGYIYENPAALDRVLFATQARSADFERMLQDGIWPDADLRSTVLLEHAPAASAPRPPGRVRIASYRNTEVIVEADSPGGGWVVLNDLWHPWWFADVDGKAAEILRANVLFRAVAVPPGRHVVRFTFRPLAGAWARAYRSHRATTRHAMLSVHAGFSPAVPLSVAGAPTASSVSNPATSVTPHER